MTFSRYKRGGKIAEKNSGSFTHKNLHDEPSFIKLGATYEETGEGLPHQYNPNIKPSPARKFTKGRGVYDESFHEPLDFGPNYQHSLAGKKHFSGGGNCAAGGKWIQGAISHPGALHRSLDVPQGHKIPMKKLEQGLHSHNPLTRKRSNLAMTLKGFHKHGPRGG